jgi:hypothetical protein
MSAIVRPHSLARRRASFMFRAWLFVRAVREVEAKDVNAGLDERAQGVLAFARKT